MKNKTFISIHKRRKLFDKIDNLDRNFSKLYPGGRCAKEIFICRYFKQVINNNLMYRLVVDDKIYVGYFISRNSKYTNEENPYTVGYASFVYAKTSDDFNLHFFDYPQGLINIRITSSSNISFSELTKSEAAVLNEVYGLTIEDKLYHSVEAVHDFRADKKDKSPLFKSLVKFKKNMNKEGIELMKKNIEKYFDIVEDSLCSFEVKPRHKLASKTKKIPHTFMLANDIYHHIIKK